MLEEEVINRTDTKIRWEDEDRTSDEAANEQNYSEKIYVTNSGECYHASGCRFLYKSKIPISHEEAKKGLQTLQCL